MSNDLLQKFSNDLKEAREKKKISIEQIFTKTRIDKRYLKAIEENNFSIMPNVYIRAFIKEYAKTIGLNPDDILDKFSKAQQGIDFSDNEITEEKSETVEPVKTKPQVLVDSKVENNYNQMEQKSKSNKVLIPVLVGLLLLTSIFVIYKFFLTEENTEIITEEPFDEIVAEQSYVENSNKIEKKSNEINTQSTESINKIEPKKNVEIEENKLSSAQNETAVPTVSLNPDELALTIVGNDKSWIRVVVDDVDNSEFIIENGITKVLTAKSKFYLHIGNSGGVKLFLNNKDIFFTGAPGKVRKIYVTEDGIEYLRRTPQINAE